MRAKKQQGYSSALASQYINPKKNFTFLTSQPDIKKVWDNGKVTDEIKGYNHWFIQEDVNPFQITLPKDYTSEFNLLDSVTLVELLAVEVKGRIYFKASDVVKHDK